MRSWPDRSASCLSDCVGPLELRPGAWPGRLRWLALGIALLAIWYAGLPWLARLLLTVLVLVLAMRRRRYPEGIRQLQFSPAEVSGACHDGRVFACAPPFACLVSPHWVSFRSDNGWLQVYADQLDADSFRRLRQVLWLQRQ